MTPHTSPRRRRTTDVSGRPGSSEPSGDGRAEAVLRAVEALVAPILAAHACELVVMEYRREPQGWVLRLYVERLGHDPRLATGGVNLETCARISRELSAALDAGLVAGSGDAGTPAPEAPAASPLGLDHAYHLEISSPGLERPLTSLGTYARFAGLPARLVLRAKVGGSNVLTGELLGVEGDLVLVKDGQGRRLEVRHGDIARAHLVYVPAARTQATRTSGKKTKENPRPGRGGAEERAEWQDAENER